jgi:hypothetical protein
MERKKKRSAIGLWVLLIGLGLVVYGCELFTPPKTTPVENTTDEPKDEPKDEPADDVAPTSLFVKNYEVDTDFKVHIWSSTHDLEDTASGTKVTAKSVGWSGGSFAARVSEDGFSTGFNFANVKTLRFKVRGTISPSNLEVFLQSGSTDVDRKSLLEHGITSLSATDWTTVEIPVSTTANISSAFSHVFEPATSGIWAEFGGIDWLDANGNQVDILN